MKFKYISCPAGDWNILEIEGVPFDSGHSISTQSWLEVLMTLGHTVEYEEISDIEMEERNY